MKNCLIFRLICLFGLLLPSGSASAQADDRSPAAQRESLLRWDKELTRIEALPPHERFEPLGKAVLKLSRINIFQVEERIPVFERAKAMMIANPGYGDYYRDQVIRMAEDATRSGPAWNKLKVEGGYALRTLELLPTAESIRALSEMLDHDKTRGVPHEGGSLAEMASGALFHMIENPPGRTYPPPWREWRERVKSGKETFQFKGSEVRYNFQGPVEASTSRSDNQGSPPTGSTSTGKHPPASDQVGQAAGESKDIAKKLGIAIAILLATAAGFWKWRAKAAT